MGSYQIRERPRRAPILTLLCLVLLLVGVARICTNGSDHANAKHPEAPMIRAELTKLVNGDRDAEAHRFKVCWSPLWGSLMVSFRKGVYEYAGIYKITIIHMDIVELTPMVPRERTAFCKTGNYWSRVRTRDMYVCIGIGNPFYDLFLDMIR